MRAPAGPTAPLAADSGDSRAGAWCGDAVRAGGVHRAGRVQRLMARSTRHERGLHVHDAQRRAGQAPAPRCRLPRRPGLDPWCGNRYGRLIDHGPKSQAVRRTVAFPKEIVPELRVQLDWFAEPGDDGLVFIGPRGRVGSAVRRSAGSGPERGSQWACPICISTIFGIPETRWLRARVRASAS